MGLIGEVPILVKYTLPDISVKESAREERPLLNVSSII